MVKTEADNALWTNFAFDTVDLYFPTNLKMAKTLSNQDILDDEADKALSTYGFREIFQKSGPEENKDVGEAVKLCTREGRGNRESMDPKSDISYSSDLFGSSEEPYWKENEDSGEVVKYWIGMLLDLHMPPPFDLVLALIRHPVKKSRVHLGRKFRGAKAKHNFPEIKKGNCYQSPSNAAAVESSNRDDGAGMLPDINTTESTGSCSLETVDGMLSSCGDERINVCTTNYRDLHGAAQRRPFIEDIYIHKSSRQPVSLPNAAEIVDGEIVKHDSFEQEPLVDFDATNSRAHQSGVLVFNSEKKGKREELNREGLVESVLSSDDSTEPNLVGQEKSSSTASHSSKKRPRDTTVGKGINLDISEQDLRQNGCCHHRKDAADIPDPNERNTCPTFKASTHGQTELVGHLHKPNEVPPDFFDGPSCWNTESSIAGLLGTPTSHDDCAGNNLDMEFSFSSLFEASEVSGCYEVAFRQKDQIEVSSTYPNCNDLEYAQPQIASENMGSSDLASKVEARLEGHGSGSSYWMVPTCSNRASSQPMSTLPDTGPTILDIMPHLIARQDRRLVTIKVIYRDSTIKFKLPLTSGLAELKEEVAMRLKLELDSFDVEYKDEDGDWILIPCDKDLRDYLRLFSSLANPVIKFLVVDKVVNANESSRSFERKRP